MQISKQSQPAHIVDSIISFQPENIFGQARFEVDMCCSCCQGISSWISWEDIRNQCNSELEELA